MTALGYGDVGDDRERLNFLSCVGVINNVWGLFINYPVSCGALTWGFGFVTPASCAPSATSYAEKSTYYMCLPNRSGFQAMCTCMKEPHVQASFLPMGLPDACQVETNLAFQEKQTS